MRYYRNPLRISQLVSITLTMPTAIIADDERLMRDQLKSRLEQVWPELEILDEAKNGEEAVALVETHKPDLAFLDIRMPVKTGLEAAKDIAETMSKSQNVVYLPSGGNMLLGLNPR